MVPIQYVVVLAALPVAATLFFGAWYDVQNRIFPKEYWNVSAKVSGFFTLIMYMLLLSERDYLQIVTLLVTSAVFATVFYVIGMRAGSGGDYRALIYASILTPALIAITAILAALFGIVQVLYATVKKDRRNAPWAVSIALAYAVSIYLFLKLDGNFITIP